MIEAIINDFREYYSKMSDYVFLKRFNFKFKFYKKLTDMSHMASGIKTRLVIVGEERKMEIWNKRTIDRMKKRVKVTTYEIQKDGSSKKIIKTYEGRIPSHWGNYEVNKITFYQVGGIPLTPEEREAYKIKFQAYAKRFLR